MGANDGDGPRPPLPLFILRGHVCLQSYNVPVAPMAPTDLTAIASASADASPAPLLLLALDIAADQAALPAADPLSTTPATAFPARPCYGRPTSPVPATAALLSPVLPSLLPSHPSVPCVTVRRGRRYSHGAGPGAVSQASPPPLSRGAAAATRRGGATRAARPAQGPTLAHEGTAAVGAAARWPSLVSPGLFLTRRR